VIKVATGFASNTAVGLSTGDGATIVLDPRTGHLQTVLMDRGWLTDVRTAAAVAVACRHLTRTAPARLAIRGTGVQAELTVRTLDAIGALPPQVAIWGRSYDKATRLAHALGSTTREIVV
jgi:ornithine cyclodeaminase